MSLWLAEPALHLAFCFFSRELEVSNEHQQTGVTRNFVLWAEMSDSRRGERGCGGGRVQSTKESYGTQAATPVADMAWAATAMEQTSQGGGAILLACPLNHPPLVKLLHTGHIYMKYILCS